jgi:hypothetical protein
VGRQCIRAAGMGSGAEVACGRGSNLSSHLNLGRCASPCIPASLEVPNTAWQLLVTTGSAIIERCWVSGGESSSRRLCMSSIVLTK